METNLYCCSRTGRTITEKTMEDGNFTTTKDQKIASAPLGNIFSDRPAKLTTNGHEFDDESSSPPPDPYQHYKEAPEPSHDHKAIRRINPLRIHLGKRPFVDSSPQYYGSNKKRKPFIVKSSDTSAPTNPRVPKLIPKNLDRSKFHNVSSHPDFSAVDNERDKPVPRLVPKSQLAQFKKGKIEKGSHLKDYAQNLGLQPMLKFKCRKCCSMTFKSLAMLKEHQLVCRAQTKEPALSPKADQSTEVSDGGPSRVTRKLFMCSACRTYYENWNLFLHMREVHNRHICLFCLGMFSKAEKLSSHLIHKHKVEEFSYESKEEFTSVYNGTLYLMCCACEEICSEQDDFFNHDCNNIKPKPVPVLISKNAVKANSVKQLKPVNEQPTNCNTTMKEPSKVQSDRRGVEDILPDKIVSQVNKNPIESNDCEHANSDTSVSSEHSSHKDTSTTIDSGMELESFTSKSNTSPAPYSISEPDKHKAFPNGDDNLENSDDNESPSSPQFEPPVIENKFEASVSSCPAIEREKEVGIKLKLSLNNAKSPVIIKSTVDPTVGQNKPNKPPPRARRPPKRYVKDPSTEPPLQQPPRTPTIKMTICDKADNPFVKTTIYENSQQTTLKTLLNNNLETPLVSEFRPDTTIKSTIYDNKIDDGNSLNRVPKLTVRVPKELLDKDSSSDYSSDSDVSDKLTVDENNVTTEEPETKPSEPLPELQPEVVSEPAAPLTPAPIEEVKDESTPETEGEKVQTIAEELESKSEPKTEPMEQDTKIDVTGEEPAVTDEIPVVELTLDKPLDKYPLKDLMKVFLSSTVYNCIYCNHVRKIAVNCEQLLLHMIAEHRFSATVNSITAEELMPETIISKVNDRVEEVKTIYINLDTYDSEVNSENVQYDNIFECFQCYFKTGVHKDLYLHNRKMHQKTILLCVMCKTNFYSYSELLCHLCPGVYQSDIEIKFRCYLCNVDSIPSSFRLMVHLRKIHHTCDVCLEFCQNQSRLSNHVWKHKLHHLCYRCGIAYRNKPDIAIHLFWKHGTESVLCKRCLQKKWPHVYHFCTPPAIFACDECSLQFTKAVYLKVHKRLHSNEFIHACTELECTEKFVSKKLLAKHVEEHKKKLFLEDINVNLPSDTKDAKAEVTNETIPIIDLVDEKPAEEAGTSEVKTEAGTDTPKKTKKKKSKDKDALLLDVNLPELNLSESDSSDESDSGGPTATKEEKASLDEILLEEKITESVNDVATSEPAVDIIPNDVEMLPTKVEDKVEVCDKLEDKPDEKQVLEIWDNFKKYQEKVEKPKEKTPPLVPIRKHVCESDHDYCLIPNDLNGDDEGVLFDKKKNRKTPKKKRGGGLSSSSSSSSDSDSSCSCGSNCSCSSSSGSSSSSSSDSDSSDESSKGKKKAKQAKKRTSSRKLSNGSNVDVMGAADTPILIPEKLEPPIAETDLETEESETDEEFYDEHPQRIANKLYAEKRNQLMMLASVAPSDGGSVSGEASRPATPGQVTPGPATSTPYTPAPLKDESIKDEHVKKEKSSSSKKKSKKKKKSKSKKRGPIKINIPKDVISTNSVIPNQIVQTPLAPNKITISLQSNTVHIPEAPSATVHVTPTNIPLLSGPKASTTSDSKRSSKRRRVPNKFYGYSSDEEASQSTTPVALKPYQPPKLEWRKEDLPSPVTHKPKKEIPSTILSHRLYNYSDSIRLTAPIPDPEPPRILMNTEMESSDSDSSDEGGLEIFQPPAHTTNPIPPPSYLNSGTSSLPYAFVRPPVRQAREGESVYCYCRCPYDEVSEMIACDAEGCPIEWFHFECVGIMVPPKGKWYCPECRKNQNFSGYR